MVKVVLVEDEKMLRREIVLTTPWAELGCELLGEAENGIDGADVIGRINPDLIITDIRMPGMDGLAMLREVLSDDYKPAVIILTGHSDFEYAREALRIGVADYILKPVDDLEFHDLISKTVSGILNERKVSELEKNSRLMDAVKISFFSEYSLPEHRGSGDLYVGGAVDYIRGNYPRDISLQDTASSVGISQGYLSRLFKTHTGYTFLEYLTLYRLRKAMKLLKEGELKASEVAAATGFRDISYFTQLFRKHVGTTPGRYRMGG